MCFFKQSDHAVQTEGGEEPEGAGPRRAVSTLTVSLLEHH